MAGWISIVVPGSENRGLTCTDDDEIECLLHLEVSVMVGTDGCRRCLESWYRPRSGVAT